MTANFKVRIENIVASGTLGIEVPLDKLVSRLEGMEYEPEQFPGLVYRMKEPKTAALIFSSGKIVCTGARNVKDVNLAFKKIASTLRRAGIKVPTKFKTQIENIVASAKLNARLNLDKIALNLENTEYEPEQFPGLVYRMDEPKVAFLFFSSGKIVCTGARNVKDVHKAIELAYKKLQKIKAIIK